MELRREKKRSLIINLTSLIDVLFLMLIFFMVTTTFLTQPAINLQLPTAEHAEEVRQTPVVIHVDRLGRVFLNDDPMELPLLEAGHIYDIGCHLHGAHRHATLVVLPAR